ncbi:hypothetical protein EWM64_g7322 [Hericium alpestre]|uniref:Uncharacterized protein n=1 Tax=Hericium alpestre TaxID=135208 RepID=A0A4Y9ZP73_9AGAM|nr:hypothetical protein EWM64_g7322 [Hericium alpestre]
MTTISNLPKADFELGLQLLERLPAFNDLLPSLDWSLRALNPIDAFAPLKPISQSTLTFGVSHGKLQKAKSPAHRGAPSTMYGAFLIALPDIPEDSSTAPPTIKARPAALPAIPGASQCPDAFPLCPAGRSTAEDGCAACARRRRAGNHPHPATPRVQTAQIVAPKMKNAPHGREAEVFGGRSGTPHAQRPAPQTVTPQAKGAPHGYKHGDKTRAPPATSHAKVPYPPSSYYQAKAPAPPKAQYPVRV